MRYRILGKTGLRVSEIGFGCGNIGGMMIRAPLEERLTAVRRSLELGINYFDTAPAYGNGQSEKNLGEVLGSIKTPVIVATKFSVSRDDVTNIGDAIRRSLEASLKSLRRNSIDILQLHTPVISGNNETSRGIDLKQVLGSRGVADALDRLRSEGLVRSAGFTGLGQTQAVLQVVESGRFDLCQVYYNLLNPSAGMTVPDGFRGQDFEGLIGKAAKRHIGVVAIRVLAGGALGGAVARTGHAAPSVGGALVSGGEYDVDRNRAEKLGFLVKGDIRNLSQAGIRFVLREPDISTALVGFSSLDQIEEAAACSDQGPILESELIPLRRLWAMNFGM